MSFPIILAGLWALLLLCISLWLVTHAPASKIFLRWPVPLIVITALGARLIPNIILPMGATHDIASYELVGNLVLEGSDVYSSPQTIDRHPYLPLQMYWMALALHASSMSHISFVQLVRLAPIVADTFIALLLFFGLRHERESARVALQGALLYAVHPIPIFVSAYHGQFDALPALCILIAVFALYRSHHPLANQAPAHTQARLMVLVSGVALGVGILVKSWPVLIGPALLSAVRGWREGVLLVGAAIAVPLMGVAIYMQLFNAPFTGVISSAIGYNWGVGVWGYTYFFRLAAELAPPWSWVFQWLVQYGRFVTLTALGGIWLLSARYERVQAATLTVLVGFLAVTHAFSIQYLMWIVPIAILNFDLRWLSRYTICAFIYMLLTYTTVILEMHITQILPWPEADWLIIIPASLPTWFVLVGWLVSRIRYVETRYRLFAKHAS